MSGLSVSLESQLVWVDLHLTIMVEPRVAGYTGALSIREGRQEHQKFKANLD